jgi:hypothetical protein
MQAVINDSLLVKTNANLRDYLSPADPRIAAGLQRKIRGHSFGGP